MLVSIIVPCYNQGKYLAETLESVLSQKYQNWECIIVNDGSNDNTEEIGYLYENKENRIKLLNKENGGLADARNYGIKHSRGEIILPLDADDLIHPEYLSKATDVFKNNPVIEIVYSRAMLFGAVNKEWNLPPFSMERMLGRNCIFCSAFFKRSTYNMTKGYQNNLKFGFQDWDLWLSILELGGEVYKLDTILFYYRQRANSMINTKTHDQFVHLRKTIWENHKNLFSKYCLYPVMSFEYELLKESLEYRMGKIFFSPCRPIWKLLRKIIYRD